MVTRLRLRRSNPASAAHCHNFEQIIILTRVYDPLGQGFLSAAFIALSPGSGKGSVQCKC